jgi:class 3 adenylate cyclase/tetratricopeptide (TPR) repeat protein
VSSIRRWLDANGLSRYAMAFEDNDIGLDILGTLTDEELHRLGLSLGDRKRLLRAVQDSLVHGWNPVTRVLELPEIESATAHGERRQVTVLFCDLVGSTALSNTHDPEEYRAILTRYHATCIQAVQRYDGYVAQLQGDGVVAYFGYPLAHEGEAERAVRAGLSVVERLAALEGDLAELLRVRIGIASGLVVVSHVLAPEKSAVGETPNLAARLQTLAEPGQVMLSERTKALAGGAFEYVDCGVHALKGIGEPTRVWRVAGASAASSRFEAATRGQLTPMVGREQEIGVLLDRWELSRRGAGQIVLLQGAPGIGKSRMLRAFRERLGARLAVALSYQCSPYYSNSAFYPIADHLERALGFVRGEAAQSKLAKLERRLHGELSCSSSDCSLIARALSIPCDERYGPLEMSPQRQKDETVRALVDVVAAIASTQATGVLFEDAHWADPTTLEVLNALIDRAETLPLLVLITFRPEFEPPWIARGHATPLSLTRLSRAQSASVVLRVSGSKPLPPDLVAQIVDKTDGVPLFLEELTKAVLESGMVRELSDHFEYSGKIEKLTIPSTLRDSLMARLDRLIPVKEIAQIGAVLGREFSYELVHAVSLMNEAQLNEALDKLVASELVFRRGTAPLATYIFKHALVQDAAYESLLKSKRQALHAQIAQVLERQFLDTATGEPEVLAHHFSEAALYAEAVPYWMKAGERALHRTALAEAVAHLTQALHTNGRLPASVEQELRELDIRMLLGTAYLSFKGHASPDVLATLLPARELAVRHCQDVKLVPVTFYLWMHYTARVEFAPGLEIVEQLDALAQSTHDSYAFIVARNVENMTYGWMGNFQRACNAAARGVEAYDPERHAPLVHIYNHDQKCGTLSWAVHFLWMLGYPDQAQAAAQEQVNLARHLGHPFNLAFSLTTGCAAMIFRGETARAHEWIDAADKIGVDNAMVYMTRYFVPHWRGIASIAQGMHADGYRNLTAAWEFLTTFGGSLLGPFVQMTRATALMNLDRSEEARRLLDEALSFIDRTDHRMHEAEVHRTFGELHRQLGDVGAAERCFLQAIAVARRQEAKGWELRAATSLAQMWREQNKRLQAYDLLAPVYEWFNEGHDTRDLQQASALLTDCR